jgi:(2Fe-2S) ferredoxin
VLAALKAEVRARGLTGRVRACRSGCLDLCEQGPNAVLYPEGTWFSGLRPEDAPRLADRLAEGL